MSIKYYFGPLRRSCLYFRVTDGENWYRYTGYKWVQGLVKPNIKTLREVSKLELHLNNIPEFKKGE